jgi:hypothetical protein
VEQGVERCLRSRQRCCLLGSDTAHRVDFGGELAL